MIMNCKNAVTLDFTGGVALTPFFDVENFICESSPREANDV